jgi:hypothetical protein
VKRRASTVGLRDTRWRGARKSERGKGAGDLNPSKGAVKGGRQRGPSRGPSREIKRGRMMQTVRCA